MKSLPTGKRKHSSLEETNENKESDQIQSSTLGAFITSNQNQTTLEGVESTPTKRAPKKIQKTVQIPLPLEISYKQLAQCIKLHNLELIKEILESGLLNINFAGNSINPLHIAVKFGNINIVQYIISQGANLNIFDSLGFSALYHATVSAREESYAIMKTLIDAGADVNASAMLKVNPKTGIKLYQQTPLHAITFGINPKKEEAIKLLLKHGARDNIPDFNNDTPRSFAKRDNNKKILCLFDEAERNPSKIAQEVGGCERTSGTKAQEVGGCERTSGTKAQEVGGCERTSKKTTQKMSPALEELTTASKHQDKNWLIAAAQSGDVKTIEDFIKNKKLIITETNPLLGQVLEQAIRNGKIDIIKLFLKAGLNINLQYNDGNNLLHFAINLEQYEIAELLLERSIDINQVNIFTNTPLHLAVISDNTRMVNLLVSHNANLTIQNIEGETPLESALHSENPRIISLLNPSTSSNIETSFEEARLDHYNSQSDVDGTNTGIFYPSSTLESIPSAAEISFEEARLDHYNSQSDVGEARLIDYIFSETTIS